MIKKNFQIVLFIWIGTLAHCFSYANDKSIYGDDNRHFVSELDSRVYKMSKAIAAMIPSSSITNTDLDFLHFKLKSLSEGLNVCLDERFVSLPYLSHCSGVLVGKDLLLTAGHCVRNLEDCQKNVWTFDYVDSSDLYRFTDEVTFNKNSVYRCKKIIDQMEVSNLSGVIDYAFIQLDRAVLNITPLELPYKKKFKASNNLMIIGHPMGMPKMYTDHFSIRDNKQKNSYVLNSDTMSGNSGSAVIDLDSKKLIGILVSGENDFTFDFENACNRNKICSESGCRGETVTSYTTFLNAIKKK